MEIGYRNREGKSRVGGDGEIGYRYGGVDEGLCVCVCVGYASTRVPKISAPAGTTRPASDRSRPAASDMVGRMPSPSSQLHVCACV